jgi:crotonobetainyl-CoA:carnitine CoA-transferase CaiB-like acyl-CoA transferase
MANAAGLVEDYDRFFLTKTRDEWIRLFQENDLMYVPVHHIEEVLEDPQALQNHYVVDFDHPLLGRIKIPGYPISFSANRAGTEGPAPRLGEHTQAVMENLGYEEQEIRALKADGVIK